MTGEIPRCHRRDLSLGVADGDVGTKLRFWATLEAGPTLPITALVRLLVRRFVGSGCLELRHSWIRALQEVFARTVGHPNPIRLVLQDYPSAMSS